MNDRRFLIALAVATIALIGVSVLRGGATPAGPSAAEATTSAAPDPSTFLLAQPEPAPPIQLVDTASEPFSLSSLHGTGVLVFFGYTHCPDVCPLTMAVLGQVVATVGPGVHAVFVTVDPERDTPAFLADYLKYLPPGFDALSGAPADIRVAADAWGVRYARVEGETPATYSMNHTSTVFLVDQAGLLRAEFPFGTEPAAMASTVRTVLASPVAQATVPVTTPAPGPTARPEPSLAGPTAGPASVADLRLEIVSSAVWAGGASPVILALSTSRGRVNDLAARVRVSVLGADGRPAGTAIDAESVQPFGVPEVSYVAAVDIAAPGWWQIRAEVVAAADPTLIGAAAVAMVAALDPGDSAPLGRAAPGVPTPTLDDAGGDVRRISTDPLPMTSLYDVSTADLIAQHRPFVLVLDSSRWKTTDICGTALVLVRYLAERWPAFDFVHLEPFAYDVVTDSLVLQGSLSQPTLVPSADAWGIEGGPWPATSMPWLFVVDGNGIVRGKYQGVIGSADVDVLIAQIESGR